MSEIEVSLLGCIALGASFVAGGALAHVISNRRRLARRQRRTAR